MISPEKIIRPVFSPGMPQQHMPAILPAEKKPKKIQYVDFKIDN